MKKINLLLICMLVSFGIKAQSLIGAWESYSTSENGDNLKTVVIFSDGYQVSTTYDANTGKFISSNGGAWDLEDDLMTETVKFDTNNPERVGSEVSFKVKLSDNTLKIVGNDSKFKRIDNGANQGNYKVLG